MAHLVNLTPHPVVIRINGHDVTVPPVKPAARVSTTEGIVGVISYEGFEIPLVESGYGNIIDLPDPKEGVFYIVSLVVAQRAVATGRLDVLAPDTGPTAVRDENGKIVAVTRLVRPKP
jgi:hypothetical protein